ncbi:hypothetical protein KA005_75960 [bacterium]|nr:hypothetical protein [bacterium]
MTSEPTTKTARPSTRKLEEVPAVGVDQPLNARLKARLTQFDEISRSAKEVFAEKNALYGDAITRTGALGAAVEIVGISARLEHMILGANDAGKSDEEALIDIVKDGVNYFTILGMMIMDNNWRPE